MFEWYGTIDNGCSTRSFGSEAFPQTFTRVRSTTFIDTGYNFMVADGYDLMTTVSGGAMSIRVRNDDDQARAIVLDVENPYDDLSLGFTGSGSVDQVLLLQPGDTFEAPLRVFTQATERAVYTLAIRLENDRGDVDRIPLVIEVRQPNLALDIQVLAVDPRTLVTTARLTNLGDTLTDLALNIVQDSTGIPANFVIQPDIQHTYLLAGQSLDIAFIPLDLNDSSASAPANMSVAQFDPLTSTPLNATPSLAAIAGPYRITASARRMTLPNVTLRDGTITNTCGAGGSVQTIAADCTTPAGSETRVINDWYCTNKPDIDVPVSLALPNGGLDVPITRVTAGANFSPGGGVYSHSTTVSLNGSLVGSAIVPSVSRIENSLAPQSLILGGSSPTQLLSLRSTHSNGTHYTVASGFTVTVEYDEHTRTGCFTQAEVDAAVGGELMCTPSSVLAVPEQALALELIPAADEQLMEIEEDTYIVPAGRQITLNARVSAVGTENIDQPVLIELTVPSGIIPRGMTIQGEDQTLLDELFALLNPVNPDLGTLGNEILSITITGQQTTFTYTLQNGVSVGQSFLITLEVVGDEVAIFEVQARVAVSELTTPNPSENTPEPKTANIMLDVQVPVLEFQFTPADDENLPQDTSGAYVVPQGRQITLDAQIAAVGNLNITDPVTIALTVPEGISVRGMTIQNEDQTFLDALFALLNTVNPDLEALVNDVLDIDITNYETTFTYTLDGGVAVGEPFPITLEVVGDEVGIYQVRASATTVSTSSDPLANTPEPKTAIIELGVQAPDVDTCPVYAAYQANQPIDTELLNHVFTGTDSALKHACLYMYRDLIYYILYHEMSALHLNPYMADANVYSLAALESRNYAPIWGDQAAIPELELTSFDGMPRFDSFYYLFGRAAINGLTSRIVEQQAEPLVGYFGSNFNSAMSSGDCAGRAKVQLTPQGGRIFQPVCAFLPFWDVYAASIRAQGISAGTWIGEFATYGLPEVDRAIYHASYSVSDPTDNADGVRPVNRGWLGGEPGLSSPFVFRTYIDLMTTYTWGFRDYVRDGNTFTEEYVVSPALSVSGATQKAVELGEACANVNETLAQSYMRNLRLIYTDATYQSIPAYPDASRAYLTRNDVRYGMSLEYSRSANALVVESQFTRISETQVIPQPFSLALDNPVGSIGSLSWQTYRFTRPFRATDTNFPTDRPILQFLNDLEPVPTVPDASGQPQRVEFILCP